MRTGRVPRVDGGQKPVASRTAAGPSRQHSSPPNFVHYLTADPTLLVMVLGVNADSESTKVDFASTATGFQPVDLHRHLITNRAPTLPRV